MRNISKHTRRRKRVRAQRGRRDDDERRRATTTAMAIGMMLARSPAGEVKIFSFEIAERSCAHMMRA
jgi:hypothetical protein